MHQPLKRQYPSAFSYSLAPETRTTLLHRIIQPQARGDLHCPRGHTQEEAGIHILQAAGRHHTFIRSQPGLALLFSKQTLPRPPPQAWVCLHFSPVKAELHERHKHIHSAQDLFVSKPPSLVLTHFSDVTFLLTLKPWPWPRSYFRRVCLEGSDLREGCGYAIAWATGDRPHPGCKTP